LNYPVVLHKDKRSDFGVTVPELPGCFSAGRTIDEALAMAKEAIELHLEALISDGQPVPRPGRIDQYQKDPDYRDGTWAVVSIDPAGLRVHAKRINITIPERILDAIDRFAQGHGQTRSGLLAEAAVAYIGRASKCPPESSQGPVVPGGKPRKLRAAGKKAKKYPGQDSNL
jgi:predicted RNase H-like HicB family nuclease